VAIYSQVWTIKTVHKQNCCSGHVIVGRYYKIYTGIFQGHFTSLPVKILCLQMYFWFSSGVLRVPITPKKIHLSYMQDKFYFL